MHEIFDIHDGWNICERARCIKNCDEIIAIELATEVANIASERMRNFVNGKKILIEPKCHLAFNRQL